MVSKLFFTVFLSLFSFTIILFNAASSLPARAAGDNVMLILDASGSMWGRVDGRPKIEVAREVVGNVLRDLGGKVNMGVIAYGHRAKGECKDIETIIPVGPVDARSYMSVINKLVPKGKTPITDAVRKAASELKFREQKATIVLVSDGLETCAADPCALAKQLEKQGIDFTVHVVGFDLKDQDTRSLQCLAKQTGGKYLSAGNTGELSDAIGDVVAEVKPVEPKPVVTVKPTLLKVEVLLAQGKRVDRAYVYVIPVDAEQDKSKAVAVGSNSRPYKVKPGKYFIETRVGKAFGSNVVDVVEHKTNTARIMLDAGLLKVRALPKEGGKPLKRAYIYVHDNDLQPNGKRKVVTSGNQRNLFTLPARKYFVIAQLGKARAGKEIEVVAGKRIDATIILASGILKVNALANEGGKPLKQAYIYIYENKQADDGKRTVVTSGNQRNNFSLPAGKYFVAAQLGKARVGKVLEVVAGKRNEATIILASGLLKIDALAEEGGKPLKDAYIYILEAQRQVDGKRNQVTSGNQRNKFSLPAGKYLVTTVVGNARVSREVEVPAGKMTRVAVVVGVGVLKVNVVPAQGAKPLRKAYIYVYETKQQMDGKRKRVTSGNQRNNFKLPAGTYRVIAKMGTASVTKDVNVSAGKRQEITVNLNAGSLSVKSDKNIYFYVFSTEKNMDGTRDRITSARAKSRPVILPAGKYLITAKDQGKKAEATIEIKAGKMTEIELNLQ